jgi:hypothetical protein
MPFSEKSFNWRGVNKWEVQFPSKLEHCSFLGSTARNLQDQRMLLFGTSFGMELASRRIQIICYCFTDSYFYYYSVIRDSENSSLFACMLHFRVIHIYN